MISRASNGATSNVNGEDKGSDCHVLIFVS